MAVNYNILNEISKKSSVDNLYYFIYAETDKNGYYYPENINKPVFFRVKSEEELYRKIFDYSEEIREQYQHDLYIGYEYYFEVEGIENYEELKKKFKDTNFDQEEIEFVRRLRYEWNSFGFTWIEKVEIEKTE